MNTILSAFSAHPVHFGQTPRISVGTATTPRESSPIAARAPQTRSDLNPGHALFARFTVVALGWALLGIYCAVVFLAFRSH